MRYAQNKEEKIATRILIFKTLLFQDHLLLFVRIHIWKLTKKLIIKIHEEFTLKLFYLPHYQH